MKGFKKDKTRVSVLDGGNAAGDKLKSFVVGRSKNIYALRRVDRDSMPTTYKNSNKAWMSAELFRGWFLEYFIPHMEETHGEVFLSFCCWTIVQLTLKT